MAPPRKRAGVRVSLAACPSCRVTYEPLPGGRACERCGARCVQCVVIMPPGEPTPHRASALLLDVLARMGELDAARRVR